MAIKRERQACTFALVYIIALPFENEYCVQKQLRVGKKIKPMARYDKAVSPAFFKA
jgi:hypothetical protein